MRKSTILAAAATVGVLLVAGGAFAARHTTTKQVKAHTAARGRRGPRGPRGFSGPQGIPGISGLTTVEGAAQSFPPGTFGAAPDANCPAGEVVVGTGFNGPFNVVGGFVESFTFFVGGFFENDSSITIEGNVQAICAKLPPGASVSSANGGLRAERSRFAAEVRRATALARLR